MRGIFEQGESRDKGGIADTQFSSSTGKQMRDTDVPVEQPDVEIDLRTDGIHQDAILNDEEQMEEIDDKVGRKKLDRAQCVVVTT